MSGKPLWLVEPVTCSFCSRSASSCLKYHPLFGACTDCRPNAGERRASYSLSSSPPSRACSAEFKALDTENQHKNRTQITSEEHKELDVDMGEVHTIDFVDVSLDFSMCKQLIVSIPFSLSILSNLYQKNIKFNSNLYLYIMTQWIDYQPCCYC